MSFKNSVPKMLKIVSLKAPEFPQYALRNQNGTTTYVYNAAFVRLISESLRADHEIFVPPDDQFGKRLHDGNWTGMIGMLQRSEVDFAMSGITLNEERFREVNFSYPHILSDITFLTDNPRVTKNLSVLSPLASEVWMVVLAFIIVETLVFYISLNKRRNFMKVLSFLFGSMLQQSAEIKKTTRAVGQVMFAWILGVMFISHGYKAVMLSFLSTPVKIGIQDISQLSKAAMNGSIKCYTFRGSAVTQTLIDSRDERWSRIGKCIERNQKFSGPVFKAFRLERSNKALLDGRIFMSQNTEFFLSQDTFYPEFYGIAYSREFCCPERLNTVIHRLVAAGVFEKQLRDEYFMLNLRNLARVRDKTRRQENSVQIHLIELSEVFFVLIWGWSLSMLVFLMEIASKKYFCV